MRRGPRGAGPATGSAAHADLFLEVLLDQQVEAGLAAAAELQAEGFQPPAVRVQPLERALQRAQRGVLVHEHRGHRRTVFFESWIVTVFFPMTDLLVLRASRPAHDDAAEVRP